MSNRIIKFRAWTGSVMEYNVVVGALGAFYVAGLDPKDSASMSPANTIYSDQTPIMQWTGLLDKNGKEIYEGDILQHLGIELGKCEVVWAQLTLSWCLRYEDGTDSNFPDDGVMIMKGNRRRDYEIIGNIYSTPTLINSKS